MQVIQNIIPSGGSGTFFPIITLDKTDKAALETYYKDAPFITFCDAKGWETQAAKDYHVFATPTYILLDNKLKILAKLNSPEHLEAWLEAKGVKK